MFIFTNLELKLKINKKENKKNTNAIIKKANKKLTKGIDVKILPETKMKLHDRKAIHQIFNDIRKEEKREFWQDAGIATKNDYICGISFLIAIGLIFAILFIAILFKQ